MENVALWHERDISHSSVERFILPDAFITTDFMLARLSSLIENLLVYPENMMKNLNLTGGLVFSQRILLELPTRGVSREDAYKIVQRNAMKVWQDLQQGKAALNEKGESLFLQNLLSDKELGEKLNAQEIRACFDYEYYAKNVDRIFKRVFKEEND
jgi:adenylosuccinate lyase